LLAGQEGSAEWGWLVLWDAHVRLLERNDVEGARSAGIEIGALATSLDLIDLHALAIALEGLARVSSGEVGAGMRLLDEASAIALSGEMTDLDAIVTTLCYLIFACERVRDYARAVQWCAQVEEVSRQWSYRAMFGVCRCHHASVLMWTGDWERAEHELTMATPELLATRPGWVTEGIVRLGALRRQQDRLEEAGTLYGQVPSHPQAMLGMAELALDHGNPVVASQLVDRFFQRVPSTDRTTRAAGYELRVRIQCAHGHVEKARASVAELEAIAGAIDTGPLHAAARRAHGMVHAAAGNHTAALPCFEEALDLFVQADGIVEGARVRLALARTRLALGFRHAAAIDATLAVRAFCRSGAVRDLREAAPVLLELDIDSVSLPDPKALMSPLSRRETDVLRLLGGGLTNHQIATALFISVRTVEHHVSAIYAKIGTEGSSARAAAAVHAIASGLIRPLEAGAPPGGNRK
jgi:ATP/maltotriose-dependent transcriptional regulator MalT